MKSTKLARDEKKVAGYRDLIGWQKGIALARRIYEVTLRFPSEEKFGLGPRCAARWFPSRRTSPKARHTTGEFVQFVSNAEGSVAELDTQETLSEQFGYCEPASAAELPEKLDELRRMLTSLRRSVRANECLSLVTCHSSLLASEEMAR